MSSYCARLRRHPDFTWSRPGALRLDRRMSETVFGLRRFITSAKRRELISRHSSNANFGRSWRRREFQYWLRLLPKLIPTPSRACLCERTRTSSYVFRIFQIAKLTRKRQLLPDPCGEEKSR